MIYSIKMLNNWITYTLLYLIITLTSCMNFSTLQNASTLSKKELEVAAEYTLVSYSNSAELSKISNGFGAQFGYGFTDRFNLRIRYQRIQFKDYDVGYNFLNIESKLSILKNVIAFSLPVCLYFGSDVQIEETINVQPSFLFTFNPNKYFDITLNPKLVIYIPTFDYLFSLNSNIGLSTDIKKYAVRLELGYTFLPSSNDRFLYWGASISYSNLSKHLFRKRKTKNE